ncbi:hypothetical protein IFU37_021365 (plasmid) [Pantoea agglomerans]|nr:hypothetical protein IFU37_021365 [Pantoea agglomerans]
MNAWLVSWHEETGSNSIEYHMLLSGQDFQRTEATCDRMGEIW